MTHCSTTITTTTTTTIIIIIIIKLATVVGLQFITPSIHFCGQHDGREAARSEGAAESYTQ